MSIVNGINVHFVSVDKLDLEEEFYNDCRLGRAVIIDDPEAFDKKNQKNPRGLQSEKFGSDFGDDNAFKERYSCMCGSLMGKYYSGQVCPQCGTMVQYNTVDLTIFGWIKLKKFKVMSPIFAAKLVEALGKVDGESVFNMIIKTTIYDGDTPEYTDKELSLLKKHPFIQKGMIWLYNNTEEVLDFYIKNKPGKKELLLELKNDIRKIWTSAIPVFSSVLRPELPGEKGGKNYKLPINTSYRTICRTFNIINNYVETDQLDSYNLKTIDKYLASAQKEILTAFNRIYNDLPDKTGLIYANVLGGRYNFSARNIIVPDSGVLLRSDECIVGYSTFLELCRFEIINIYVKTHNVTPYQANLAWKRATNHFDNDIYKIMKHVIALFKYESNNYFSGVPVLLNRNPSINYGSFIFSNIVDIKKDINDKTLTIPTHIIGPANADFDGDLMNIFRIFSNDLAKKFDKTLNPRKNFSISRMDGKSEPSTAPIKDEVVLMYEFANI